MGPRVGETICGDLHLVAPAPASFGAPTWRPVFVARSGDAGPPMWLTVIDRAFVPTSLDVSRFMAGTGALSSVHDPALADVVLVDREDTYCVVGYEAIANAHALADVRPSVAALADIARSVARGLSHLHERGVVHGALSPATIAIAGDRVTLWQHGLLSWCVPDVYGARARASGDDAIAPEILAGDPCTPAADVFAWGAIVAAIATGGSIADAIAIARAGRLADHLDPAIAEIVEQALLPSSRERVPDATQLLARLGAAAQSSARPSPAAIVPGGTQPADPQTMAGWLRQSDRALDDPAPRRGGRWPVAFELPGGIRKRTFAAPDETIEDDTPRDGLPIATETDPLALPLEPLALAVEPRAVAGDRREEPVPEPEPAPSERGEESGDDLPTAPAGDATIPSVQEVARPVASYRPPRMPGPHGPSAIAMALTLVLLVTGIAIAATHAAIDARGLPSGFAGADARACPEATVPLPGRALDPLTRVCIEIAEYPEQRQPPRADLDRADAERVCTDRGRRLCTSAEWQRACAGLTGRAFPYADRHEPHRCRDAEQAQRTVSATGDGLGCITPEGVHDMVGNVAEWVAEGALLGGSVATDRATCATAEIDSPHRGVRCCVDLD